MGGQSSSIIYPGDCVDIMRNCLDPDSVDSVVCDPPYGLSKEPNMVEVLSHWLAGDDYRHGSNGFMNAAWDAFVPGPSVWREAYRVLKPGGWLVAFFGTRTYDMGVLALRLAGFEIRDQLAWVFGSGFPKNPTCLKPAQEPIVLARKPLIGSVAANVAAHGIGPLQIDACRIGTEGGTISEGAPNNLNAVYGKGMGGLKAVSIQGLGRWPANVLHDGSDEVLAGFPYTKSNSGNLTHKAGVQGVAFGKYNACETSGIPDEGSAARFYYCAKASKRDRDEGLEHLDTAPIVTFQTANGASGAASSISAGRNTQRKNTHPTVKPTALMQWLVRLVTPPGGTVLDPFTGSGSTGKACALEGLNFIGCEMTLEYIPIAQARIAWAQEQKL